jgi:hypothetical protein
MGDAASPLLAVRHPILATAVHLCSLCRLRSMYSSPCMVGWGSVLVVLLCMLLYRVGLLPV